MPRLWRQAAGAGAIGAGELLMASKYFYKLSERTRSSCTSRVVIIFCLATYFILLSASTALAAERVPWPVWLIIEGGRLGIWAAIQFWGFLGFVAFVPLKRIVLGAVLTLGGAFLPDVPALRNKRDSGTVAVNVPKVAKINFRGAPRYAVLVVGILIVISSLWRGISDFSSE